MVRSVPLKAYFSGPRHGTETEWRRPTKPRPEGALVWLHAASDGAVAAMLELAERMRLRDSEAAFVLTRGPDVRAPRRLPPEVLSADLPPELPNEIDVFLDHWKPDVAVWSTGHLRATLLTRAGQRGVPLLLAEAETAALAEARWRWLPDTSRGVIGLFRAAHARTANAAQRLYRLGLPAERIEVTGPLQRCGRALPCDETMRDEVAKAVAGRPVWLAAMVRPDELDSVLRAHRLSTRSTHRLLLILVPDDEADGRAFAATIRDAGWRTSIWSEGDMPGETTQILLADTRGEMGLWFRLAPIAFMGGSLTPGHRGSDPCEPAALGAAILSGPNAGRHLAMYERLTSEGAAKIVRDSETLAKAVSRLTAPDQAATMAHAAWTVATEGAEATDKLLDQIEALLDEAGAA